jgi:hypothetical protein
MMIFVYYGEKRPAGATPTSILEVSRTKCILFSKRPEDFICSLCGKKRPAGATPTSILEVSRTRCIFFKKTRNEHKISDDLSYSKRPQINTKCPICLMTLNV